MSVPPAEPPLRIDWLPDEHLADGRAGRLGLTVLPGKHGPSLRYPGRVYRRVLADDLATLGAAGVRRLLLLVEDRELERWGDVEIVEHAAEQGITVERRPIPDGDPPATLAAMDAIAAWLDAARERGNAAVACMGGVGRAGTIAACALVRAGHPAHEAIGIVRRTRHPTAVETSAQERFVAAYESHVRGARPSR